MSTVGAVIDRALREYLYPPGRQPAQAALETTMNTSVTTVVYTTGWLSQAEIDAIGPGTLIELDTELMLVSAHVTASRTLTVTRGMYSTTAAAHTAATCMIRVKPPFTRKACFDALADEIENLWPDIYRRRTVAVTTADTPVEITNGDAIIPLKFQYPESDMASTTWMSAPVELLTDNTTVAASGNAVQFSGLTAGRAGVFTYGARFPRPTAEADDLSGTSFDLPTRYERLLVVGIAVSLISATPIDDVHQDFIAQALAAQGFPPGSKRNVMTMLLNYKEYLLGRARRDLLAQYPITVRMNQVILT